MNTFVSSILTAVPRQITVLPILNENFCFCYYENYIVKALPFIKFLPNHFVFMFTIFTSLNLSSF